MYKVNEAIEVKVLLLDNDGNPVDGTINYVVYDETDTSFATGTMSKIGSITGFYTMSFTPDAAGEWTVFLSCSNPQRSAVKTFAVGKGIEKDNYDLLTHATYGLNALDTDLNAIITKLDNPTYGLAALETLVDDIESLLNNATYGLSALKDEINANETKIDGIKTNTDKMPRLVSHMDFWSDNDDEIILTTTVGADHNLPNLVVSGIPENATIIRVVALLKIALIKDMSGADNAINGATALKVDADSEYGSTVTAIDIPDNSWAVDVSEATERGGDVMIGDNDVKTEITGNGTWYARLEDIICDGNNLKLKDVAWGIRVYFTI
jgi:hypothetical protein